MKMTLSQALEMIDLGETPEQFEKRYRRFRRLVNDQFFLEDKIAVLEGDPAYAEKVEKLKNRLEEVKRQIKGTAEHGRQ